MTQEEEKLKAKDDNAQLALEFTKEFNECIEKQVPKECAAFAVLHDLADWKDQHPRKGLWDAQKVIKYINEVLPNYVELNCVFDEIQVNYNKFKNNFIHDLKKAIEEQQ